VANQFFNRLALLNPRIGLALALALTSAGCAAQTQTAPASAFYRSNSHRSTRTASHTVALGETVYHIAHEYGVSTDDLMSNNGLTDPRDLQVGQVLVIPGAGSDDSALPPAAASAFSLPDPWSVPRADRQFAWPVTAGVVSSPFGMRNGTMHEGVDITAPAGTPIYAADDGTVIYVGHLHGYGNVVIVQHSGGYVTVYGHNQRNLVNDGESVTRGQQIAEMGTSGRASGSNLHFEVRFNNRAENPVAYLPEPSGSTGISFARNGGSWYSEATIGAIGAPVARRKIHIGLFK
jgi:murein DD-endopeptidase MepM/ murein hydrolase activator NlpD